jgi:hypothetical protein
VSLSAIDVVLRFAKSQLYVREIGPNAGQVVEQYQKFCGAEKGDPWCACGVSWCGKSALEADWPLVISASCQRLYVDAKAKGLVRDAPKRGDIFLLWHPELGRYAHTGFVENAVRGNFDTIEGNTNPGGGRDGYGWFRRKRVADQSFKFIRWSPENV